MTLVYNFSPKKIYEKYNKTTEYKNKQITIDRTFQVKNIVILFEIQFFMEYAYRHKPVIGSWLKTDRKSIWEVVLDMEVGGVVISTS